VGFLAMKQNTLAVGAVGLFGEQMPHSVKLRNGTVTFSIKVPKAAAVGDSHYAEFGFVDNGNNIEPLKFGVLIRYVEAEAPQNGKSGKNLIQRFGRDYT
jgi:hypothetical protein